MVTLVGTFLCCTWHPDHLGYSGTSSPANGPDPAAATRTLFSLVSSWSRQLTRVPWPCKERETLLTSLYFPPSFLSLTLPILMQESGQRASAWLRIKGWSPPLCRELKFWLCSGLVSGLNSGFVPVWPGLVSSRAEFQSSLLWKPSIRSCNTWILQVAGDVCKATPFASPSPGLPPPLLSTWLPFLPLKSLKT